MFLVSDTSAHNRPSEGTHPTLRPLYRRSTAGPPKSPRYSMFGFNLAYPGDTSVTAIPEESVDYTPSVTPQPDDHRNSIMGPSTHLYSGSNSPSPQKHRSRPRPVSDFIPRNGFAHKFHEPLQLSREASMVSTNHDEDEYHLPSYFGRSAVTSENTSMAPSSEDETHSEFSDNSSSVPPSISGTSRRRSKRLSKTGSRFIIAQPPPKVVKKSRRLIQTRPQLLLQIQAVTETRPKPVFDVLPSSFLSNSPISAPRLVRKFPRLFGISGSLGVDDLVLARSEDYGIEEEGEHSSEERIDHRELIAVFSPSPDSDNTEIVTADGAIWTATPLPNGSFDFLRVAEDGTNTRARWARRRANSSSVSTNGKGSEEVAYKYTFSILDPTSRRHPIMATITPTHLDIQDYCNLPDSDSRDSSGAAYPNPRLSIVPGAQEHCIHAHDKRFFAIDAETRAFIAISSVWVSLRVKGLTTMTTATRRASVRRSLDPSMLPSYANFPSGTPSVTITESTPPRASQSNIPASSSSRHLEEPAERSPRKRRSLPIQPSNGQTAVPRRSISTGAAFMRNRVSPGVEGDGVQDRDVINDLVGKKDKKGLFSSLKRAFSRRKCKESR